MMRFSLLVCLFVLWMNMDVSLSQNDPLGCGIPPPLADGDAVESVRFTYSHGEMVKYTCQGLYTMEGELYKTCENGEWTGEMRCLKPCVVSKEIMDGHNIVFRFTQRQKLYLRHNDDVQFRCKGQTRHDLVLSMRQRCVDGVMQLPDCF
ncbi:complement factor H-related protein 2 [Larimichthys crocea]|nr:complement factor H-related protein 2 [Larimichthys crocea]XP_019132897.1 complement factor H-related protein 2 [Larimichthys crocea]